MSKFSKYDFIEKSKKIHGNKYDYSKVDYINSATKVCIMCPEHGEFLQLANDHVQGSGCTECSRHKRSLSTRSDQHIFIKKSKKIHGNKYDYSKVDYINSRTKVSIICPEHGEFSVIPNAHISMKSGCPVCGEIKNRENKRETTDIFIEKSKKIHGNKYDYSKVDYVANKTKVCIICPEHGEFWQTPNGHKNGNSCPRCRESMGETKIVDILNEHNINFLKEHKFEDCKNINVLRFDFYLPEQSLCIEYDGKQHYNEDSRYYSENMIVNDNIKNEFCIQNNITLLRIPYWRYRSIEKILRNNKIIK